MGAIFGGPLLQGIKFDTRMAEVDTLEAIRKRRSIRRYTDDAIPKADLETIVDAGRLAATGSNRQPWDFVVVTDRTMIAAVQSGWRVDRDSRRGDCRGHGSGIALVGRRRRGRD